MPDFGIFRGISEKSFGDKLFAGQLPIELGYNNFCSEYIAVLSVAKYYNYTLPSFSQQLKQNDLLLNLKSSGVWSKLDSFGLFATDGSGEFALIDWKRLALYTAINSPTFSINGGFTGNGTSAYIDTNFNPTIGTNNYQLNDAGRFYWVDNQVGGGVTLEGTSTGGVNVSTYQNAASQRINQGTTSLNSAVNLVGDGFRSINRTSSTNVEIFFNVTQSSRTATSTSVLNSNQWIFRGNFPIIRFRFYAMGASLVSENADFYNAINTYLTSL